MLRMPICAVIALAAVIGMAQAAEMKPTAPDKMASPSNKEKMKQCEARAVAENVRMDHRAKFIMDCLEAK
jgi:hypothetical protein